MKKRSFDIPIALMLLCTAALAGSTAGAATVGGELRRWHTITLTFEGPSTSEAAEVNPFTDYRLNVMFRHGDREVVAPGFYAADGDAAETGADSGNKWRVRFCPDAVGEWTYRASFRTGNRIALSDEPEAGEPTAFDGDSGAFTVGESNKSGRDFRGRGMLEYVGERYLRFAGDGRRFLKGGADSPENFLAYAGFDNTNKGKAILHRYQPHVRDWTAGDPTWRDGRGKGVIGALNYLASKGMNSVYFITMNVGGDGDEVFPWTGRGERFRFDCSKLAQWEIVFSHMNGVGIVMHVLTQETENDQLLDGGALGPERKLYYRELIARFAHHPGLVWNLGEENTNTTEQQEAFARFIKSVDPYDHPIVVHTFPNRREAVYAPLLGFEDLDGPSIQTSEDVSIIHRLTRKWLERSREAGHPWFVCIDEPGSASRGADHDARDPGNQDDMRKQALWGDLMAGGSGVEWYFGYENPHGDLNCEDWRSRDDLWEKTAHALRFFQTYLPFSAMAARDELVSAEGAWCLAKPGEVYAIYLPNGGSTRIDLEDARAVFDIRWFDPREGGDLQVGSRDRVTGPGAVGVGSPPSDIDRDWAALLTRRK